MTTTATAVSEFGIKVTGAEAAAREMAKVKAAVDANTKAANDNAVAQKRIEDATKKAGVSIGQFGSSLGLTGQALGKVNPAMGQLVAMTGSATGVIQTLTTAGLGPLGIALSAVSLAVSAGSSAWASWKTEQDKARESARQTVKTLEDLISAHKQLNEQLTLRARVTSGRGTADEQAGFTEEARLYANTARGRITGEIGSQERQRTEAEARRAEQVLEYRRRLEQQARERESYESSNRAQVSAMEQQVRDFGGGGASRPGGASRRETEQQRLDRLMRSAGASNPLASLAGGQTGLSDPDKERIRLEEQLNEERIAKAQAAADRQLEIERQLTDAMNAEAEKRQRAVEAEAQARVEAIERTSAIMGAAGNAITGVYGFIDDASKKSDETEEQKQKRQLRRIGVEQAIQAVVNAASAAAAFARYDIPAGISYTAAAALNVAAAAKAGVDAGNVKASPAGGMRPDSPTQRSGSREPQNIVVNLSGPVIATADRAALGRELSGLVDEGRARYAA